MRGDERIESAGIEVRQCESKAVSEVMIKSRRDGHRE